MNFTLNIYITFSNKSEEDVYNFFFPSFFLWLVRIDFVEDKK